ncbi:hypothetical protein HT118_31565 [Escherichia coli]|nr:hypothetical protein [Escherichia coli]
MPVAAHFFNHFFTMLSSIFYISETSGVVFLFIVLEVTGLVIERGEM